MAVALSTRVKDVMMKDVVTATPNSTAGWVAQTMEKDEVGCMPVTEHGRLVGIITDRDIVIRGLVRGGHGAYLADTPIRSMMSYNDLATVAPDDSLEHAVDLVAKRQVRRLPVVQEGKVVGLISLGHLIQVTGCTESVHQAVLAVTRGA